MNAVQKNICILIIFLLVSFNSSSQTGVFIPELINFDTAMAGVMSRFKIPGGQLALTYHGRLVYNRGFGYANFSSGTAVSPGNVFRVASVSKPITSIAIMYMVEKGMLHLNDYVFGEDGILNDQKYRNVLDPRVFNIRVRDLLNHTAGWNRNISGDPISYMYNMAVSMGVTPPANEETATEYIVSRKMLDFIPGSEWQYSNIGYIILGRIIEKITGQNYEEYLRNNILLPLGADIYCGFNRQEQRLTGEVNYYDYPGAPLLRSVYDNSTFVPAPYAGFNIEGFDAAGGWVASASDLCRLLAGIDKFPSVPDILLPSTIDTMVKPSPVRSDYAKGWFVNNFGTWWHDGSLPGTGSYISRTSAQINWAILLNSRPSDIYQFENAVGLLVWNVLPTISKWPENDLYTGSGENIFQDAFTIFPNPSNGRFFIKSDFNISRIEIYNLTGILVYRSSDEISPDRFEIDISDRAPGLYLVLIINGNKSFQQKIIINK